MQIPGRNLPGWATGASARPAPAPLTAFPRRPARPPSAVSRAEVAETDGQGAAPRTLVELGFSGGRLREVQLSGGEPKAGSRAQAEQDAPAALNGGSSSSSAARDTPLGAVRDFFLPRGWPDSVTPDYLRYQMVSVPTHITGHVSHSLATSSMIQALGLGYGPAGVVATSAAIKWITKDGLGAAGRLIVGGRLASVFDEDPRRWRMISEGVSTLGMSLEIATQMFPSQFVALAGAGTLAKSMAKGMGRPAFRVIQTHFSASNNVGDVAAKEEVWEVAAQLAGLATSVVLLQALQASGMPEAVFPAWVAAQGVHVALRYTALSTLRFNYPNQKRAALLATSHVSTGQVPGIEEVNAAEDILQPPSACRPRLVYGCTLAEVLPEGTVESGSGSNGSANGSSNGSSSVGSTGSGVPLTLPEQQQQQQLAELVQLYSGERYLLTWQDGTAWVALMEGSGREDMLRAMWQAAWLERHHATWQATSRDGAAVAASAAVESHSGSNGSSPAAAVAAAGAAESSGSSHGSNGSSGSSNGGSNGSNSGSSSSSTPEGAVAAPAAGLLAASLEALRRQWPDFQAQAAEQGWELEKSVLPQGRTRLRLE